MTRICSISSLVVLSMFEMYCNASLFVDATVHTIDERCPILKLFAKLENPIFSKYEYMIIEGTTTWKYKSR